MYFVTSILYLLLLWTSFGQTFNPPFFDLGESFFQVQYYLNPFNDNCNQENIHGLFLNNIILRAHGNYIYLKQFTVVIIILILIGYALQRTYRNRYKVHGSKLADIQTQRTTYVEVQYTQTVLYSFIKNIVAGFESLVSQKQTNFCFDYHGNRELIVLLDQQKVEIIIITLLYNAFKFSPPIHGNIKLVVNSSEQFIEIMVIDHGVDIPTRNTPHAFERNSQSGVCEHELLANRAIGLAICKEYIQILNGKIDVQSQRCKGTIFYVKFPQREVINKINPKEDIYAKIKANRKLSDSVQLLKNTEVRQKFFQETEEDLLKSKDTNEQIIASIPPSTNGISDDLKHWLEKLDVQISNNISNTSYTIDQLAFDMAIGKRQLARRIKAATGITPREYIKNIRYNKALEYLENQTCPTVKEVAYAVGLKDAANFSRQFKARYGRLPSDYLH